MELYHWIVLVIIAVAVVSICSHIVGTLGKTAVTVIAVILFAGFVWGTLSPESKESVSASYESIKVSVGDFFEDVFHFGETLPDRQEEAKANMYK